MADEYRIIGAEMSPYSVKVRSYFRYKVIPHQWVCVTRNFSDLHGGLSRWPAWCARAAASSSSRSRRRRSRPCRLLLAVVRSPRIVPLLGRVTGEDRRTTYLPNSVKRFPGPRELGAQMHALGLRDVRSILTAGGIIALHSGTVA